MNGKDIYPAIWHLLIEYGITHEKELRLETYLRVKHRGKYYLWKFYRIHRWGEKIYSDDEVFKAIFLFYAEVYRTQIFGKVNLKLRRDDNGITRPVFELDPDQRSEAERLMSIINPKK